ncbi:MAG TPA: amino acid adenylation domain-containing protein [Vulgatibacter sp.]|nr:amino acid adenylation domain-containing protein [Vulgatibacter sp.]
MTQAGRTRDRAALVHAGDSLSYRELEARARSLARHLRRLGVEADVPVAICLPRSFDGIVAVLGVLMAGGAYVPLDPTYPQDRLAFMLEDSGARILITTSALRASLPPVAEVVELPFLGEAAGLDLPEPGSEDLAYVIYTSGSTGRPKAVAMPHGPLANLVTWQLEASSSGEGRTLQFAPLSFDVHFQEIFSTLGAGGTLVLLDEEDRLDSMRLLELLEQERIERVFLPFVALQALAEAAENASRVPSHLREVVTAGEQLQITRAIAAFFRRMPEATLHNHYGPSETHVATAFTLEGPPDTWPALPPIGRPLPGIIARVLDDGLRPVPDGSPGELYLGGRCLARGYLDQPELTAERFVLVTGDGDALERLYRTGDLVRRSDDGALEFLGRTDDQVKVRGFRIELGEVEVALASHPSVSHAVALVREERPGDKRLYGYVQLGDALDGAATALRNFLLERLPEYLVPSRIVVVDAFPRTPSGKIDRKALPAPGRERPALAVPFAAASTSDEALVAGIWREVLGIDTIGVDDSFFDLGGTSLLAVEAVGRMQREGLEAVTIPQLFQHPTIRSILAAVGDGSALDRALLARAAGARGRDDEPVAIVGMAARFPGAADLHQLWNNLVEGVESITFFGPDELDPAVPKALASDPRYVRARGILADADRFDAAFFGISPAEAEVLDPQQRVFLEVAWAALESAGYVPECICGAVGVYAGVHNNTYFPNQVAQRPDVIEKVGDLLAMVASEKDYVATRVAHRLDLRGPAISIHTACSTSLVAVAQAFHALRTGQCDMAIAGGAAITVPQHTGHVYDEGGMLSSDGHCRPFDAAASGTVFSDGAGAVVLKRLSDALRDGDPIRAVLRGVGLSNDGGGKASFSAPSVEGQAAAIAMAHANAGIDPRSISYVEAHGTATPLGDPIEVEALTRAFRLGTQDAGFCQLGSIKSNFGHLTAAAGVAGLIKTVLALENEELPPTLHFQRPNPHIDFAASPFVVTSERRPWPRGESPRRAGVSSFGVGGTNAHVVLEEAPARAPSGAALPRQLVVLSGRTPEALEEATSRLAEDAGRQPDRPLADISYTLGVGRRALPYRRAVVAATTGELAQLLRGEDPARVSSRRAATPPPKPAFLFPGQGAQSVGMGEGLYRWDPTFRSVVDRCAGLLEEKLGRDLRDVLYPAPGGEEEAADLLRQTSFTQPALFVVEYALAQIWLGWGIRPEAMAGHSVGEFVAACIAGVFSLEDALALVAERGRLMQSLPPGGMLSVRASADAIRERLPPDLAIASLNAPTQCVVAGPVEALESLCKDLEAEDVACRPLVTSHAFHSPMMDPVVEPFEEAVRSVRLHAPRLPIVSTVTGGWMSEREATDPGYWSRHLREPVRFADALGVLLEEPSRLLLEVGPRATLTTLARQRLRGDQLGVASLRNPAMGDDEWTSLLGAAGEIFCAGLPLDFESLHAYGERYRLPLPTYPFERRRHWVTTNALPEAASPSPRSAEAPPAMEPRDTGRISRLLDELRALCADISGIESEHLEPSGTFLELGFDSLMLTQLARSISRKYSASITFRQLMTELPTLDALAAHLDASLPAEPAPASERKAPPVEGTSLPAAGSVPTAGLPAVNDLSTATPFPTLEGFPATTAHGIDIQALIQQQLQLMARQLAVLGVAPASQEAHAPLEPLTQEDPAQAPVPAATAAARAAVDASDEERGPVRQDVKKAFGTVARPHAGSAPELTPVQKARLDSFVRRYGARTSGSKAAAQASRDRLADPRVVSGFRPATKELAYPLVVVRSRGSRVWDVDGNEYVDVLNGFGSNLLGHGAEPVVRAIREQLENGFELGLQTPLAGEVASLVCELTGMERAAFCNTGTEAVIGAVRMARAVTGRGIVALFSGSSHGIFDEDIASALPAATRILSEGPEDAIVLDYGEPRALEVLRDRASELAAVLVEPVQGRRPDLQPHEFLQELRAITAEAGTALIFDEAITGFRSHPGGAQAHFGVRADIAVYGEVVGGGMPIGVIAGSRRFLDALDGGAWQFGDDSAPSVGVTCLAGTFVRHPLAMAAAKAVLLHLVERGPALQEELNARTERLTSTLNAHFTLAGAPLRIERFASMWRPVYEDARPLGDLLYYALRDRGVHVYEGAPCFLTTAHTDADVDRIIAAFREAIAELQDGGFLPAPARPEVTEFDASRPPVPGARLGRDPEGNPAWYVLDPDRPGRYVKLEA